MHFRLKLGLAAVFLLMNKITAQALTEQQGLQLCCLNGNFSVTSPLHGLSNIYVTKWQRLETVMDLYILPESDPMRFNQLCWSIV